MDKKRVIRISLWIFNILVIALFIWSFINYKILGETVTKVVENSGLIAMIILIIILEGAPVFVGPSLAVAAVLSLGTVNPYYVLFLFLASAIVGNILWYYLGYFSGKKILKHFDKKDVDRYKRFFKKHGGKTLAVMAVSPIPYLPTLAGAFRLKSIEVELSVLMLRLIRHMIVFAFWYFVLLNV